MRKLIRPPRSTKSEELLTLFHLLTKELDHDDGEVTATMKVRRASVYKAYAADIEALYA